MELSITQTLKPFKYDFLCDVIAYQPEVNFIRSAYQVQHNKLSYMKWMKVILAVMCTT